MKTTLLLLLMLIQVSCNHTFVTHIIDGDTFVAPNNQRIRLAEIDAPESNQFYGKEAEAFLARYINYKSLRMVYVTTDKYGRKVCNIYAGDLWINRLMVDSGYAWAYKPATTLMPNQIAAEQKGLGLWGYSHIDPYLFRKTNHK